MRLKLIHKFLAINLGIIAVLTCVFIALSHGYSRGMLSRALNGIDADVMEHMAEDLSAYLRERGSWQHLIDNQAQWNELADKSFVTIFSTQMNKVMRLEAPPPHPLDPNAVASAINGAQGIPFGSFRQRLSLLDQDRRVVLIAAPMPGDEFSYQPVRVDGNVVAWLRVAKVNLNMMPLALYFFDQQLRLVFWAAIIGGCIAAALGVVLSRHVTAPIQRLTQGAQQVAARKFDTVIDVRTSDELRDLAESFNTLSRELARYQRQQQAWLTNVSHELKSPLTLLVGEIFAICDNLSRCDAKTVELVQAEALHIKRIADDLQEACKLDEFGLELSLATVDLTEFTQHQLDLYQQPLTSAGLTLNRQLPEQPLYAAVDVTRLAQVLRNLLDNGLRYCDAPGELRVALAAHGDAVTLQFDDTGPGVPDDDLPSLFERRYQFTRRSERGAGGTGVGLAICRQIVLAHGGTIEAFASSLGGLGVRVTLPTPGAGEL